MSFYLQFGWYREWPELFRYIGTGIALYLWGKGNPDPGTSKKTTKHPPKLPTGICHSPQAEESVQDLTACFCLQEGCLGQPRSTNQPPPPPALALGLEHPLGHQTASSEPPALVGASSHPRTMPLHRTNQLALEVSETAAPVLLFGGAVRAGTGVRVGFVLEDTVTSLCPQQPGRSPHAPQSVAVIPALNFTINCQRWLAGIFYGEIWFGFCLILGFHLVAERLQLGLSVAGEDRECY